MSGGPCLLLCNELLLALGQAKELHTSDRVLFLVIIKEDSEEQSIVKNYLAEVDRAVQAGSFTQAYVMSALPSIRSKLVALLDILIKEKKDMNKLVNVLQTLFDISIRDLPKRKRKIEDLRRDGLAAQRTYATGLLFANAVKLPDANDLDFYRQVRRLKTILVSRDSVHNISKNLEARRRIAFFTNSLFMNMPHAPQVEKTTAFSVLTPYYNEEFLYSKEKLRTENEDGISTLFYLQKIYDDEWTNFLERMRREGMKNDKEIWSSKVRELRIWASHRGQTLSRTVRGMMYYCKALHMLAYLDSASEMDIREGLRELGSVSSVRRGTVLCTLL